MFLIKTIAFIIIFQITNPANLFPKAGQDTSGQPRIISRILTAERPKIHGSIYLENSGYKMRSGDFLSTDNGRTWLYSPMKPDPMSGLPYGFRRNPITTVVDHNTGNMITIVNALDVKDLDPTINEPPIALNTYYLRYMISTDKGNTWQLDQPIIQKGKFAMKNPLPGITIGKNSIFLGDAGSIPIVTKKGKILVPAQATLLGGDGKLANPGGGYTYTDVVIIIGKWKKNKIVWTMSSRLKADPSRSSRGLIEPTLLELNDGRIIMVMRGSNEIRTDPKKELPGYKWFSISQNGGKSWTTPEPFGYEDGTKFYSPSAMSTLFKHSSGRCFWIGNISKENSRGNLPRWPLVIAELNTKDPSLVKNSLLVVDTQNEEDKSRGRLDISHFTVIEDRETKEILLSYPRNYNAYKSTEWVTVRIAVN